ncbi:SIR2 family protein [Pseudomonas sp. DP-17]|uniref:SIR2 family protein n=1 Tax=Pseudomonas sp. DP-17 TaxID=1580486 RepID=UPI001EFA7FFB|nr:SIR2 family protein [Pseudomonas sp. DP-17]MCG8906271.1 SIR2 family protein [Pseudomonas sp. DP-17]
MTTDVSIEDRVIALGDGLAQIPERLLLAHARGEVLFICGAGISIPAGLPDFRKLVVDVYEQLDPGAHAVISQFTYDDEKNKKVNLASLNDVQRAEARRFLLGDYDVVLGMLERRLDGRTKSDSKVRAAVANQLRGDNKKPVDIHRYLMRLADRGVTSTILTTNFDLLLEKAKRRKSKATTFSLGAMPRPTRSIDFSGVLHIHGAIDNKDSQSTEFVLSDQDFGEFYLRRRTIPDFIYDAARLFNLVLIGYSANDPPMRYLLNAVAADNTRFEDLKERFTFWGLKNPDPVVLEDWKARGITPISYDSANGHSILRDTFKRWADFSAINGVPGLVDKELRRIVKTPRKTSKDMDRDLFDHLIRRSNTNEKKRLTTLVANAGAEIEWLNAILKISSERGPI